MRSTIFLDFDGVLHPEFCLPSRHFELAPKLVDCLAAHTAVDVVIGSTWRDRYALSVLKTRLPSFLAEIVVGSTPDRLEAHDIPDRLIGYQRHPQCWLWQREHKAASDAWLAIDDRACLFYPLTPHLIECKSTEGLTDEIICKLEAALKSAPRHVTAFSESAASCLIKNKH